MLSIDVVIPSYRLQSEYLIPIVQMDIPAEAAVRFLVIADNPNAEIPKDFEKLVDGKKVILFRNKENRGVCKARNFGIDNSKADWILFIDDDVKPEKSLLLKYVEAIKANPEETGFFGEVIFPPPSNLFTKGISASVILTFFTIGQRVDHLKWAPTPNVMIKRSVIGKTRFDDKFDKFGASEEIDFFLKIYRSKGKELCAVKDAKVYHDWWNNGKRNYNRFMRWAGGFTLLIDAFPEYSFYNYPNLIESLVVGLPVFAVASVYFHAPIFLICFLLGVIAGECSIEFLTLWATKGFAQGRFAIESALIRASMDIGKFKTQVKYQKIAAHFCRRFDHFCDGKHIDRMRLIAAVKCFTYVLFPVILYYLVSK